MAEIRWTKESVQWLQDIYEYIAHDNKAAAKRVVEGIYQKVQTLKRLPEQGYRYYRFPEKDIRIMLYGHYRIAYLINSNKSIDILGVFHGALDIDRYIF